MANRKTIEAAAFDLCANGLRFLDGSERPDPYPVKRAHVPKHCLIDLGILREDPKGLLCFRSEGLGLPLGAYGSKLDAILTVGLGWLRA